MDLLLQLHSVRLVCQISLSIHHIWCRFFRSSMNGFFPTSLCGVLVFGSVSRRPSASRLPSSRRHNLSTHNLSTHNLLTYTLSSYILSSHNLLTNNNLSTHNLSTHNLLTYTLSSHILSSHNLLTHNLSSHNLLTHNLSTHNLSTQLAHTQLVHTQLVHTQLAHIHLVLTHLVLTQLAHKQLFWRARRGTWRHLSSLWVAGVALTALGGLVAQRVPVGAVESRVAGVALGDIHLRFAWQAWHWVTSAFTLRGRRGTYGTGRALVAQRVPVGAAASRLAGVALGDIYLHFAWQAWHLRHWEGSGGAAGSRGRRGVSRGRRGTWRHPPSFCVAGVALGDIRLHVAWQAWHLRHWAGSGGAAGSRGLRGVSRGRRGTWRHPPSFCVAGVALGDIRLHVAWQAWHLRHWAGSGGAAESRVAGVALGDIHLRFAWQAWHWVTSAFTLRGRRGTYGTGRALVAQRVPVGAAFTHLVITQLAHTHLVITQVVLTQLVHTQLALTDTTHAHLVFTHLTQFVHTSCHHTTCSHTSCHHTTCPHTTCPHTTCPHRHNSRMSRLCWHAVRGSRWLVACHLDGDFSGGLLAVPHVGYVGYMLSSVEQFFGCLIARFRLYMSHVTNIGTTQHITIR